MANLRSEIKIDDDIHALINNLLQEKKIKFQNDLEEALKEIEEAKILAEKSFATFNEAVLEYITNFIKMVEDCNLKEGSNKNINMSSKLLVCDNNMVDWDTCRNLIQKFFKVPITMKKTEYTDNSCSYYVSVGKTKETIQRENAEKLLKDITYHEKRIIEYQENLNRLILNKRKAEIDLKNKKEELQKLAIEYPELTVCQTQEN